jgi:pyrroloquinoline quinone biosynthesis protein B
MKIVILGAAAGGGSPQWNCRCPVCALAWSGDPRVKRRTQVGFAVTLEGGAVVLFNCSPDIREQISANSCLQPQSCIRSSPLSDIVLTSGDVDHVGGLLSLREGHQFSIHATPGINRILASNPIFGVLNPAAVKREIAEPGERQRLSARIEIELFTVPGKIPLYLETEGVVTNARCDTTVGIEVVTNKHALFYVPACAEIDRETAARLENARLVFFDGTLWSDDEMIRTGTGMKTGRRMGHMPVGGPDGSLVALKAIGVKRLIYIHINNTNPMLIEGSPENEAVRAAGAEVGFDGQEIDL